MPVHPPLPELLRSAREKSGLSQVTVAARMGTSQSAVARAESAGGPAPTITFLERYASAVGRPLAPVITPAPTLPPTRDELHRLAPTLTSLAARLGFEHIRLVGSVARDDARADSDVDLIVSAGETLRGSSYFDAMDRLRSGAEQIIARKVDVIDLKAVTGAARRQKLLQESREL